MSYNDNGTWRTITGLFYNDNGTWRTINAAWYNDNGTWRQVYSSAAPMSLSKDGDASGTYFGSFNGDSGNAETNTVTISVSGGVGPFTYSWSYVSGDPATVNSPSSASTSFTRVGTVPSSAGGTYRCTVTDTGNGGATATIDVIVFTDYELNF
ncbi:MAG: PKD domain-containing protein [Betaproteobacteria bacterium]